MSRDSFSIAVSRRADVHQVADHLIMPEMNTSQVVQQDISVRVSKRRKLTRKTSVASNVEEHIPCCSANPRNVVGSDVTAAVSSSIPEGDCVIASSSSVLCAVVISAGPERRRSLRLAARNTAGR